MQALTLAAILLAIGAPDKGPKDSKKPPQEQMQGEWKVEKSFKRGQPAPPEEVQGMVLEVIENRLIIQPPPAKQQGGRVEEATFILDVSKNPVTIDINPSKQANQPLVLGVIEVNDQMLKMAFAQPGQPRPTTIEVPANSTFTYLELRRIKK